LSVKSQDGRGRRVLVLWMVCITLFLFATFLVYPRLDEFALLEDSSRYLARAKDLMDQKDFVQAAQLLEGVVRHHRPPVAEPYSLLADAYGQAGNRSESDYWRARAEFQKTWSSPMVKTPGYLSDKWKSVIELGERSLRDQVPKTGSAPKDLIIPVFRNTMRKWELEGGAQVERWVEELTAEEMLAILVSSGDLLVFGDGRIGNTGSSLPRGILVESSGSRWAAGARITVGDEVVIEAGRSEEGFLCTYLAPDTGEPIASQRFDVAKDPSEALRMRDLIRQIPEGRIVALAVSTGIGSKVDRWVVEETLALIGVNLPTYRFLRARIMDGAPFAAVGVRGAAPGSGICNLGETDRNKAAILILSP
jgi:hypothetical protein